MKLRPSALNFAIVTKKNARGTNWGLDDGDVVTQDGTLDRSGCPASKMLTGGWRGASFTLAEQVMANTAFFAVSINLVTYLTTVMHENTATAVKNVSNWYGAGWFAPLIGGFIADAYCGRYWGAFLSNLIYILGLAMMTISASLPSLRPPQCPVQDATCKHASTSQDAFFYIAIYVMAMGSGGVQGTVLPFGADQFDEEDEKEKKQKSSYFNWFYQAIYVGSLVASTFFVYIEDNVSWGLAWGISCGIQTLGTFILALGVPFYRYHPPGGNPLTRIGQVLVAAFRKRRLKFQSVYDLYEVEHKGSVIKGSRRMRHSNKFRFLDKAAIVTPTDNNEEDSTSPDPWHLCTVTQVEESKFLLRVIPIFCTSIMYSTCYNQLTTLFVTQGSTMDRSFGGSFKIPAASLAVFESLSVLFWIVSYDRLLVPLLRKRTGNPRGITTLKRVGIGLGLSVLAMTLAAVVEIIRLRIVARHGLEDDTETPVPISVFWLTLQYFVMGASEVFTYVGLLEFFYDQAPDAIRSVGGSISMLTNALGSFLASLLVTIVNDITKRDGKPGWIADILNRGRIDLFFWVLAVLSSCNLLAFIVCAHHYEYTATDGLISRSTDPENNHASKIARDKKDDEMSKGSDLSVGLAPTLDKPIGLDSNSTPTVTVA